MYVSKFIVLKLSKIKTARISRKQKQMHILIYGKQYNIKYCLGNPAPTINITCDLCYSAESAKLNSDLRLQQGLQDLCTWSYDQVHHGITENEFKL